MNSILRGRGGAAALAAASLMLLAAPALAGDKESYEAKVKENDATIVVIAGVINEICPKIAPPGSALCNTQDAVKKAVELAKHIDEGKPVQSRTAADQFWDAVEQFKQHYPLRDKARDFAKKGDFKNAFGYEEYAFQYLVKAATHGIAAKNLVGAK
jgi:hypothetical protein